jgi:hypothetical protein
VLATFVLPLLPVEVLQALRRRKHNTNVQSSRDVAWRREMGVFCRYLEFISWSFAGFF